jgi:hypothetical protein
MSLAIMQVQRFGSADQGHVHPVTAVVIIAAIITLLGLPRRYMVPVLLAAAILIPMDQVIVIGGFHFQMIRVLVLAGWVRVLFLGARPAERRLPTSLHAIDKALLAGTIIAAIDTVLLWQNSAAFTNQLGTLYTVFGIYFLLRLMIRDFADVLIAIRSLVYICGFVAIIMTIEQVTHHNPYAYVWAGAVDSAHTVMERDGQTRAMACFAHPLLAGTFGGISLPLFCALWSKGHKRAAALGIAACTVIVLAANSSTPLLAYAAGILGICFWPFRRKLRLFRWGVVITLTALHLAMKAPVWSLIARIDLTGSSSGYHRYQLVDQFIRRFGEWWLLGTNGNAKWGWDMWDLANQYVAVGETSGLVPFLFFLATIVYGFKYIGRARKAARGRSDERFIWAIGAALFANVIAFFGISYYDQTMVCWYLLLALIPAACASVMASQATSTAVGPEPEILELVPASAVGIASDHSSCQIATTPQQWVDPIA